MDKPVRTKRRGDTLVECILAAALAAAVFVPALSALRLLVRNNQAAHDRLVAADKERDAFLTAAAEERLGLVVPEDPSKAVGFPPVEMTPTNKPPETIAP